MESKCKVLLNPTISRQKVSDMDQLWCLMSGYIGAKYCHSPDLILPHGKHSRQCSHCQHLPIFLSNNRCYDLRHNDWLPQFWSWDISCSIIFTVYAIKSLLSTHTECYKISRKILTWIKTIAKEWTVEVHWNQISIMGK